MVSEADIKLALNDLKSHKSPNYTATANKYNVDRNTLSRRYKGICMSNHDEHSAYQNFLPDAQEEVILGYINDLSDRGMPPTPQILENIVIEIVKQPIGRNWITRFCQRYRNEIKKRLSSLD
ncbi:hypothetical protein Egran_07094 [Elaphomyces granulatus]|uniref:HTH CENPB-type domain-containing protein n=1 Tax=Elaphomyces granulatus TaxID=519963 RepID=A0A232LMD2_9EURO|nr:hypothetical protein Egran_07094 [Elaphomyces granulatus]